MIIIIISEIRPNSDDQDNCGELAFLPKSPVPGQGYACQEQPETLTV